MNIKGITNFSSIDHLANGIINITINGYSLDQIYGINLLDMSGRLIENVNLTNLANLSLDISTYSRGVYTLELIGNDSSIIRKQIIKN